MTGLQVPAELDAPASAFVQPGEAEGSDPRLKAALENVVKKRRGLNPALMLAPVAGQAFDAYSTQEAMKAGGREGNPALAPIAGNTAALYGTKVGIGVATALAAHLLAKSGHRTLGKIVAGLGTVAPVAAGVHNMQMAGQR
jgi:hypothetical protein